MRNGTTEENGLTPHTTDAHTQHQVEVRENHGDNCRRAEGESEGVRYCRLACDDNAFLGM